MQRVITGSCHCGAVTWRFEGEPDAATACNCTVCRRYGTLWAYDWDGEKIKVSGETKAYIRGDRLLGFYFCPVCACVTYWRSLHAEEGRLRIAVNLRLAEDPQAVAQIPIEHFDGLNTFEDLGRDGRCVADYWF